MKTIHVENEKHPMEGGTVSPEPSNESKSKRTSPVVIGALLLIALMVGVQGYFVTKTYLHTVPQESVGEKMADVFLPGKLLGAGEPLKLAENDSAESDSTSESDETESEKPPKEANSAESIFSPSWDPFKEMAAFRQSMNRLFDESLFGYTPSPVWPRWDPSLNLGKDWASQGLSFDRFSLGGEVQEKGHAVVVTIDLPDVDEDSLDIKFKDGVLTVSGRQEKTKEQFNDSDTVIGRSRSVTSFSRTFNIPSSVNADAMSYEVVEGKLKITLPKIY